MKTIFYSRYLAPMVLYKQEEISVQGKVLKPAEYIEFSDHLFETDDQTKIEYIRGLRGFGFEYIELPEEEAIKKAEEEKARIAPKIRNLGDNRDEEILNLKNQVATLTQSIELLLKKEVERQEVKQEQSDSVAPKATKKPKEEVKQE